MAYDPETDVPNGDDTFDVDRYTSDDNKKSEEPAPLYKIYKGSKIPVSRAVGTMWKKRYDAAIAAYNSIYEAWDECFRYYNNNQTKSMQTPRGSFNRGDSSENLVYSNLNVMLPAVYSKDPDIAVNSVDEEDQPFMDCLRSLLNTLFASRHLLNAKPKLKRAVGLALLTNFGVLKIDYIKKDDSLEMALQNLAKLTDDLTKCTDSKQAERIYGEIEALENTLEVYERNGPTLKNVMPHNLIIDPNAEDNDAMDATWMIERIYLNTEALIAQFTEPCYDEDGNKTDGLERNLVYKPTHRASFAAAGADGRRDDGLGLVMTELSASVQGHEDEERQKYRGMYYSECYAVWDKTTRRVMLYSRDDWSWPIWVWDDPLKITRFFPYFVIGYGMSTGGTVSVGETAYYLDQQDEINDINRQVARIRRTIFDFFFYNSDAVTKEEAEKFVDAIRGNGAPNYKNILGVRAGEKKISDMVETFMPSNLGQQMEAFFNKEPILNTINRISNTSDALRGTQFKTNTNEAAVQSYQDAARMAVGAKIDVVEDCISDMAQALAELCVQNMDEQFVASLIGKQQAAKWQQMDIDEFRANYNFECVAGTTEKPNSQFKKKEAVQIAQAMGQFASAAPITSMKLMLRVLQQAFTEVVIKPEDWDQLNAEAAANAQKGNSTGAPQAPAAGQNEGNLQQQLMALPPQVKQHILQMKQQGASDDQIKQFLMQQVQPQAAQVAKPQQAGA